MSCMYSASLTNTYCTMNEIKTKRSHPSVVDGIDLWNMSNELIEYQREPLIKRIHAFIYGRKLRHLQQKSVKTLWQTVAYSTAFEWEEEHHRNLHFTPDTMNPEERQRAMEIIAWTDGQHLYRLNRILQGA